jgi:hypothetical protein
MKVNTVQNVLQTTCLCALVLGFKIKNMSENHRYGKIYNFIQ